MLLYVMVFDILFIKYYIEVYFKIKVLVFEKRNIINFLSLV